MELIPIREKSKGGIRCRVKHPPSLSKGGKKGGLLELTRLIWNKGKGKEGKIGLITELGIVGFQHKGGDCLKGGGGKTLGSTRRSRIKEGKGGNWKKKNPPAKGN